MTIASRILAFVQQWTREARSESVPSLELLHLHCAVPLLLVNLLLPISELKVHLAEVAVALRAANHTSTSQQVLPLPLLSVAMVPFCNSGATLGCVSGAVPERLDGCANTKSGAAGHDRHAADEDKPPPH
eukprot:1185195-Prorocentrum_minimum.AAC.1